MAVMDKEKLEELMKKVAAGEIEPDAAVESLKNLPFEDLGFANIDNHRKIRTGYPEAVFCQGKTVEQVAAIMKKLAEHSENIIGSRASKEQFDAVKALVPDAVSCSLP